MVSVVTSVRHTHTNDSVGLWQAAAAYIAATRCNYRADWADISFLLYVQEKSKGCSKQTLDRFWSFGLQAVRFHLLEVLWHPKIVQYVEFWCSIHPLFWVKFDLTQLVWKVLAQSADAIDKNDRSNTDGMPPANTQPRKPNNSLFNGSTLRCSLWCIGQSSAHTLQRSSPFPPSATFIRPEIQQPGWSRDKDGGMRAR